MVRVKICGHTNSEDLAFSISAGADAVGLVYSFHGSPRNLDNEQLARLLRRVPAFVEGVIVTNPSGLEFAASLNPGAIQLVARTEELRKARTSLPDRKLIPVIHVSEDFKMSTLDMYTEFESVVLDTPGLPGGSGRVHDWKISRIISKELPYVVLAGGLTPENVLEAIQTVEPYAVDVSSGVEAKPGIKDHNKVLRFIRCVQNA